MTQNDSPAQAATPQQALLLWKLLGRGGEEFQSKIKPAVKKADREALIRLGLLTSKKTPRKGIHMSVSDRGWRWAQEHLDHQMPVNYGVLQDWLTRLGAYLQRAGAPTLAEFFEATRAPEKPETPETAIEAQKPKATREKPENQRDLRGEIVRAYLKATGGKKSLYIPLLKIRTELADFSRQAQDAALLEILKEHGKISLGQVADQKSLSAADRAAAFKPGVEAFHLLRIDA